jgi:hypothetical protein
MPLLKAQLPGDRVTTVGVDFARSGTGDLSVMALMTEATGPAGRNARSWSRLRGVPYDRAVGHPARRSATRIPSWGGVALDSRL